MPFSVVLTRGEHSAAVKYGWSAFIHDFVPPFPEDNSPSPKFVESLTAYRTALLQSNHHQSVIDECRASRTPTLSPDQLASTRVR